MIRNFTATKALVRHSGKILLLRESNKYIDGINVGQYDVPGGRINPGEELLDGLSREVMEESGLEILHPVLFFDDHVVVNKREEEWHIHRHYFACDAMDDKVTLSDDHDEFIWIDPRDYASINIIANLKDVFDAYLIKQSD